MAEFTESTMSVELDNLAVIVEDVALNMRVFSLSMRALYSETALGDSSNVAKKLNKIRDDTREDALLYVKGILPVSTELVRTLQEFFDYYQHLSFEEWKEHLPDILEDVKGYRQCCKEVIELHENIMIPLQRRADEAKVLIGELNTLTKELERKKSELESSATILRTFAIWLMFVPRVSLIATPLLSIAAEHSMVQAVAEGAQCNINNAAVFVVNRTMIPALSAFIEGLKGIAGFFSVVEQNIATLQIKGEKALENPKKVHYTLMKKKANQITQSCMKFFSKIPGVKADIVCIPQSGTDMNYVDKWLKQRQEEIKNKYEQRVTGQLSRMLTQLDISEGEKLMIKGEQ